MSAPSRPDISSWGSPACRTCGKPVAIRARFYCCVGCEIEAGITSSDEEIVPLNTPKLRRVKLRRKPKAP